MTDKNDKISLRKFAICLKNEGRSRSIGLREHDKKNLTDYSERVHYNFLFPESLHDAAATSSTYTVWKKNL